MTGKRTTPPHRRATRRSRAVHAVGTAPAPAPPAVAEDDFRAPDEIVAPIADSLISEVARARQPLEAELVPCTLFGVVERGIIGDRTEREGALTVLLNQVAEHAERRATAGALAVLRVLSVLGPHAARETADDAAQRLVALGVPDRPWASIVGRPTMLRAWRWGDVYGEQESVGVLFSYRGRDHALTVLIDHLLGGGVKDCWLGEGRRAPAPLEVARQAAAEPDVWFRDVDAAAAAAVLSSAVQAPTVPVQDDQIEDVSALFHLALARTDYLCRLAGLPAPRAAADASA